MVDAWKNYASAPDPGVVICAVCDIEYGATKSVVLNCGRGDYPILLIATHDGIKAYVNACPHQYLPLDYRGDKLLSADGALVRCTNHGAAFCVATGKGVEGLGVGLQLDPVPIHLNKAGNIVIGEAHGGAL